MMFSICLITGTLVFLFFLNRLRVFYHWSDFTKMYGYIRLCEDESKSYEEKTAFWMLYEAKINEQKWNFILRGRPKLIELPDDLQPKAKIFNFQSYKEKKKPDETCEN